MAVSRAESEAVRLERRGEVEEAAKLRKHADAMRYEDPYTALQDELDEAIKNEVIVDETGCTTYILSREREERVGSVGTAKEGDATHMAAIGGRTACCVSVCTIGR